MHHPEHDGVHIHRHGVLGQRLFGIDFGGANALVDPHCHRIEDRDQDEKAGAFGGMQLAQPQDHRPLPLLGHLDGIAQEDADQGQDNGKAERHAGQMGEYRPADKDDEDKCTDGIHANLRC